MNFDEQTYLLIAAYIEQTLSATERIAFEKRLEEDTALATEVQIHREMHTYYTEPDTLHDLQEYPPATMATLKKHLASDETAALSQKIRAGKRIYENTQKRKKRIRLSYYAAAAAILVIFLISQLVFQQNATPQELYAEYKNWEDVPSLTVKGTPDAEMAQAEALFLERKYAEAITIFEKQLPTQHPHLLIYMGISYLELNAIEKARHSFDTLLQSNTLDSHKAYWYIALSYLKQGDHTKAITYLELVRSNPKNYGYEQAEELLEAL